MDASALRAELIMQGLLPSIADSMVRQAVKEEEKKTKTRESKAKRAWPTWDQPDPREILSLAHLIVPYIRFLDPEVIQAVVEDNERHRETWTVALQCLQINPTAYLWEKSPCTFPGVRRRAGKREIAGTHLEESQAIKLDDNDYPKQLWSFVFRGGQFSKLGPEGYALAHLADHKVYKNRYRQDFEILEDREGTCSLFGLYTCPSNTIYIPEGLIKPTDFDGTVRSLLFRKAQELYGTFCNILPSNLRIPEGCSPEWDISEFNWADTVGTTTHLPIFLDYRREKMAMLFKAKGVPI